MLRAVSLLGCALLVAAGTIPDDNCTSGVFFNQRYYEKEILKTDLTYARDFSYLNGTNHGGSLLRGTNTLFFSYTLPESHQSTTAYLDLDTKEFSIIPGIPEGFTTAVDTVNDEIYLGGSNGVYKFEPETKSAKYLTARGVDIWSLFYYEQIYYVSFPELRLFDSRGAPAYQSNNTVTRLIGNPNEYFLVNDTGLYRVINEDTTELFGEHGHLYRSFSQDADGNIYVFDTESVYVPNRENKSLDKVAEIENLRGLAFDRNNNIIYSEDNAIIRLTPSLVNCTSAA